MSRVIVMSVGGCRVRSSNRSRISRRIGEMDLVQKPVSMSIRTGHQMSSWTPPTNPITSNHNPSSPPARSSGWPSSSAPSTNASTSPSSTTPTNSFKCASKYPIAKPATFYVYHSLLQVFYLIKKIIVLTTLSMSKVLGLVERKKIIFYSSVLPFIGHLMIMLLPNCEQ